MEENGRFETEEPGGAYNPQVRIFIFFGCLLAVFVFIIFQYGKRILGTPVHAEESSSGFSRFAAGRGPILDRNGRILAIESHFGNLSVWRPGIRNIVQLSGTLAPFLKQSPAEVAAHINNSGADFLYLKKHITQEEIREIEALVKKGMLDGVKIEPVSGRVYPEGPLASQIIGFVGSENTGLAGIEYSFNEDLSPRNNGKSPGKQVVLTIDANIQYILEGIGNRAYHENNAEAVILCAMDPHTGDILGAASVPGFDPNNFQASTPEEQMFRPGVLSYEPGSVFKVFSIAAFLDGSYIDPDTTFFCNGYYEHTTNLGERIRIKCLGSHGTVNAREIIVKSCNAGAARASEREGSAAFYSDLKKFGFGSRTSPGKGAGLSGETAGFLRSYSNWSGRTKPTIAMGQEIAVSALQMLKAATAVAGDGVLRSPRLVKELIPEDGGAKEEYIPAPPERVLKERTARQMRDYMEGVTGDFGTGWRAFIEDIPMAVKTGTAQIIDKKTGAYSNTDFIASCIAFLPAKSPVLVIYIAIFKPKGESYLGGRIAAPYIRESAESLVNYMGIPRGRNPLATHSGSIMVPKEGSPVVGGEGTPLPDFTDYSKRRILPLLLRDDLNFDLRGEGWVVRQEPPPGTPVTPGMLITLDFN